MAYTTQGVSTYYTANSHTYRNPHFPGVVKCIHTILNHLILPPGATPLVTYNLNEVVIEKDTGERVEREGNGGEEAGLTVFDCAAGGGEATVAVRAWAERVMPELLGGGGEGEMWSGPRNGRVGERGRRRGGLRVYASDPFTNELYEERVNGFRKSEEVQDGAKGVKTGGKESSETMGQEELLLSSPKPTLLSIPAQLEPLSTRITPTSTSIPTILTLPSSAPILSHPYIPCHSFFFRDIPLQGLDILLSTPPGSPVPTDDPPPLYIDLTFISFALHLCPPSELFSLLYELSRHSAYLVVIAPHKNPHIPGGGESGWVGPLMEVLVKKERVRGRVFRSVNF